MKKKFFKNFWKRAESLVFILILWTVLASFFPLSAYLGSTLFSIFSWGIMFLVFGYFGYKLKKDSLEKKALKYGAFLGAISGFVGALIGVLIFYTMPGKISLVINSLVSQGVDFNLANLFLRITIWLSLIINPLISGMLGSLITWIAASITENKNN